MLKATAADLGIHLGLVHTGATVVMCHNTVPSSVSMSPLLLIKKAIWPEVFQVSCCSSC